MSGEQRDSAAAEVRRLPKGDDIALLHGSWSGGNTQVQNQRGEWIPAIPLPFYLWPLGYRCDCGRKFWRLAGYQGHYALEHILALEPWVRDAGSRRFWRSQWRQRHRDHTRPASAPFEHTGIGVCNLGRIHDGPCDYGNGV